MAQDHGAVVFRVVGTVEKSHRAAAAGVEYGFPAARIRVQLVPVSPSKLLPALRSMVKPLAQLRAGRDFLHPRVCFEGVLLHATRPESLHQDSSPVCARRRLVSALDLDHAKTVAGGQISNKRCISTMHIEFGDIKSS